MAPLAAVDLVGWDVHKAIVDNVHANCKDEAHEFFAMPAYMSAALANGCLGDKTPERGGFYRRAGKEVFVLDPKTGGAAEFAKPAPIEFLEKMKQVHPLGRHGGALEGLSPAQGRRAQL